MSKALSLYLGPCKRCQLLNLREPGLVLSMRKVMRATSMRTVSTVSVRALASNTILNKHYGLKYTLNSNWRTLCTHTKPEFLLNISDSDDKIEYPTIITSPASPVETPDLESTSLSQTEEEETRKQKSVKERQKRWIEPEGFDTGIRLFNSQTRRKDRLILPKGRLVRWYACGPTVYDSPHIGHASTYMRTDLIRRIMRDYFNLDVLFVMGVTDVDDKIINRSNMMKSNFKEVAEKYEKEFFNEMDKLSILPPIMKTRVSDHIPQIIAFIQRIMDNGYAYRTKSGSVYFDLESYGQYGRLSPISLDYQVLETLDTEKNYPRDFVLWKAAKPGEPYWSSPWGNGRPGWHIECSAMTHAVFGETLDIHSGGADLILPHHENEVAQSEACFCSRQWTNYWLHTGSLHQVHDVAKMSKSLKNTISISEMLESYTVNQFRFLCMIVPYRAQIDYSEDSMDRTAKYLSRWQMFLAAGEAYVAGQIECCPFDEVDLLTSLEEAKTSVDEALRDSFNMLEAVNSINELMHKLNPILQGNQTKESCVGPRSPSAVAAVLVYIKRMLSIFGLDAQKSKSSGVDERFDKVMDELTAFRNDVRHFAKNPEGYGYKVARIDEDTGTKASKKPPVVKPLLQMTDRVRSGLDELGIIVQDRLKSGTWLLKEKPKAKKESDETDSSD